MDISPAEVQRVAEVIGSPHGESWFHGSGTDRDAVLRLYQYLPLAQEKNGLFLVYESFDSKSYNILVFYEGKPRRWPITRRDDGRYIIGEENVPGVHTYDSVKQVVEQHMGVFARPLPLDNGGGVLLNQYIIAPK